MAGGREEQQTSIQDRGRGGDCLSPLLAAQPQAHNPQGLPLSRSWFRPSWPAVGRRLPSRRQKPSGPLSSTSRPRPMDATHTHMRLAGGAEDMGAKDGGDGREDCVWSSTTRDRWLSPGTLSVSLPGLLGERGGENIQPPPCPPLQCLSTQLSCLWLIPRAESIREPTDSLDSFIPLPPPLGCPLFFHEDDDDEHNGTQEQQQASDKERPFRGPSHLPPARPLAALLAWTHCRCHSATPSPTGRLFPSRVAGLYWQNEPSSYQRRHLPVALPSPTHTPLFKVQNPHCHPPRKLAHTPMQHASGEPRTKTTSRLPCQW